MELQMVPGDWTDVCEMLTKCRQPMREVIPLSAWDLTHYMLIECKNGTIVLKFNGYHIKEMDVSTKSIAELEKELGRHVLN